MHFAHELVHAYEDDKNEAFAQWFDEKEACIRGMDAVLYTCFIDAHKHAQKELVKLWGNPDTSDSEHTHATSSVSAVTRCVPRAMRATIVSACSRKLVPPVPCTRCL